MGAKSEARGALYAMISVAHLNPYKNKNTLFIKINHRSINLKTWLSAFFVKDVSRYNFRTVVVR